MSVSDVERQDLEKRFSGNQEALEAALHFASVAKGTARRQQQFIIQGLRQTGYTEWLPKSALTAIRRLGRGRN